MKKYITSALFLFFTISLFSQIKFEKGYFISNDGERTECLIKNEDWDQNPSEIFYKTGKNEVSNQTTINDIKEFGINGISKYERHTVQIDFSSQSNLNDISQNRQPEWEEKAVFLKVLLKGNTTLYRFRNSEIGYKYLYKTESTKVNQLVYKEYLNQSGNISKNLTYLEQLNQDVNCANKNINQLKSIGYTENELTKYFKENELCINPDLKETNQIKKTKSKFNLKINGGVNLLALKLKNRSNDQIAKFDTDVSFRFGLELEHVLPFNKNKWSLFIDPNYYSYNGEFEERYTSEFGYIEYTQKSEASIKKIAIPVGVRHYMFINETTKLFLNLGVGFDFDIDSFIEIESIGILPMSESIYYLFGGTGINISNKYSAELRYFSVNHLGAQYEHLNSHLNTLSFIISYNFL